MPLSSVLTKDVLESITGIAETWAQILGFLAVLLSGIYFLANQPLKKMEAEERLAERRAFETKIAGMQRATEELKVRRLELEAIVAPRSIRITKGVIERLERATGTVLHVEYRSGDIDAHRLAERIQEVVSWAGWRASVAPSKAPEYKPIREIRTGVEITGGAKLSREDWVAANWEKLPKNLGAAELHSFLRANGIEATLYTSAFHLEPGKPIVVRVWAKPLPQSKYAVVEGVQIMTDMFSPGGTLPQATRDRIAADETRRLEDAERLRKEWYPDSEDQQ